MLYSNKSEDEIILALKQYQENYKARVGVEFDSQAAAELYSFLGQEFSSKKEAMFKDIFGTWTAKSILDALVMLDNELAEKEKS